MGLTWMKICKKESQKNLGGLLVYCFSFSDLYFSKFTVVKTLKYVYHRLSSILFPFLLNLAAIIDHLHLQKIRGMSSIYIEQHASKSID